MTAPEPQRGDRLSSDRAQATHQALVELAAELFAEQGYAQTSMRDIARVGPVSMGAIYLHFKNKAEMLVEAIHHRMDDQLESIDPERGDSLEHVERLKQAGQRYPERRKLRALLVQAAAASQTDDDTRERLRAAQYQHVQDWIERYEANRDRIGIEATLDTSALVHFIWAVELGLGVLEAFGMDPGAPEQWGEIQARLAQSLLDPEVPH